MNRFIMTLMGCWACLMAQAADAMTIRFAVSNATAGKVAVVHDMQVDELELSADGTATWNYDATDAVYAKVYYGEKNKEIYMERGDQLDISFDAADLDNTFAVKGGKEGAIAYLNQVKVINLPDETFKLPFDQYLAKAEKKAAQMTRLLSVRKLDGEGSFVERETGRIRYFFACSLLMYPVSHAFMAQDASYQPDEAYYAAVRKYVVENETLADVAEYRNFMIETAHIFDADNSQERDAYRKSVAEMNYIGENIQSDKLRERLIFQIAFTWVEGYGVKDITDMQNVFNTYVTDSRLLGLYKTACAKWDITAPGRPSPDFKATDINGKVYSLRDFRGKYVYIDMWATWCGPCQRELPYLKKLEAQYRGRNITFVSLSIDSDKAKWEAKVKSGTLCGTQLLLGRGSQFQRDYGVEGIPHFILLDPLGRIVNAAMTRPSSDDTAKILDKYVK